MYVEVAPGGRARRDAGNVSVPSAGATTTIPSGVTPLFADGFESGRLRAWDTSRGLFVEPFVVHDGRFAATVATIAGQTYARQILPTALPHAFARAYVNVPVALGDTPLVREVDAAGNSIGYVFMTPRRQLGFHDDATDADTVSVATLPFGWHSLELGITAGASGSARVWLDGAPVPDLSVDASLGTVPIAGVQIGDAQRGTWRSPAVWIAFYDDVAFGTRYIGT